jgi:hypothetical protein
MQPLSPFLRHPYDNCFRNRIPLVQNFRSKSQKMFLPVFLLQGYPVCYNNYHHCMNSLPHYNPILSFDIPPLKIRKELFKFPNSMFGFFSSIHRYANVIFRKEVPYRL